MASGIISTFKLWVKQKFCTAAPAWPKSDWKILLSNSDDYLKMMALALNNGVYTQVLHNGHIAMELILKSAISRSHRSHPKIHEILRLADIKIDGATLFSQINSNPNIQISFNKIYTAWDMHYRYMKKKVGVKEAQNYYNAFQEAYKWTRQKYCQ